MCRHHKCDERCYDTCGWDIDWNDVLDRKRNRIIKQNGFKVNDRVIYKSSIREYEGEIVKISHSGFITVKTKYDGIKFSSPESIRKV